MRRRAGLTIMATALVCAWGGAATVPALSRTAAASTVAASTVPPAARGQLACRITDSRVTEVSGLVATATGYVVINDSSVDRSKVKIFFLDDACKLSRAVSYPTNPLDPEDLTLAKDGTLWVADIGDNSVLSGGSGSRRSSIALWSLAPDATTPVIHRFVYPDGQPRDAETLLLNGDGTPVIVTKEPAGEVYVADGPMKANNRVGTPLRRVGSFRTTGTGTSNPLGFIGAGLITGGAVAPDGGRAVVRTMSDAYEFDVRDGDVAKAITTGSPRITPLPDEPQGEAISYTPDGRSYVTGSDRPDASEILRYAPTPAAPGSASASAPALAGASPAIEAKNSGPTRLTVSQLAWIVAALGGAGIIIFVFGLVGVIRSRAARRSTGAERGGSR